MRAADVEAAVHGLIRDLRMEGHGEHLGYEVDPMLVYTELRKRRPDVLSHIKRYYRSDPYQVLKIWVARTGHPW